MATVKLILRRQKTNQNGDAPIYLRILKDRKAQFISLNLKIDPKDWDDEKQRIRKAHPNANQLNAFLSQKVAEAQKLAYEKMSEDKSVQTNEIKNELIGRPQQQTDIFKFAKRFYDKFEDKGQHGTHDKYVVAFKKLANYMKGKPLYIEQTNLTFIKDYENYLRVELGNRQITINTNMKAIKRVIREAIDEEIIGYDKNPFLRFHLESTKSDKVYLTEEEIQKLESLTFEEEEKLETHRDVFIFSTYAGGLRVSDICLLRWENFHNGYITVTTMKTTTTVSIKLPLKAMEIIDKYKPKTHSPKSFIFPFMDEKEDYTTNGRMRLNDIRYANVAINKSLKTLGKRCDIEKNISCHTARHSFATRALRRGMRIEYVSKLMAHSDIKVTQIYAKIVNEELDKAMDEFMN
jgi:integrase/recombinase XerD